MKLAAGIVWADQRLHRASSGRLSLVAIAGLPSLRLTSTGRRSGLPRSNNLLYYPYGDQYVLTGSNWGKSSHPAWTFNLRAHPEASIALRGKQIAVRAREVKGPEYDELWRRLLEFWPGYAMERDAAGRELPIFILSREKSPGGLDQPFGR
ncbi:nitroreductase family deazaflavin-dependent oxidoreductase [Amycolatopsis nigrescens]|uniref:nitroreductase family deazaflavin-dependent oxidoreductase n=1 Tax=Amycolatopsis nigrescens TaxID=381445 RepID=UPI000360C31C|nr:nitroreductase family deazaflavin-dependent oxidoreductase [Amycolatopsis nigrescens]